MARPRSDKNARLKLVIEKRLADSLEAELEYLGIPSRALVVEDREIENRTDFLRTVINGYARRLLDGGPLCEVEEGASTVYIDFYLDRVSRGLWESCIRGQYAANYNELANQALQQYFNNKQRAIDSVSLNRSRFRALLAQSNPHELRDFSI